MTKQSAPAAAALLLGKAQKSMKKQALLLSALLLLACGSDGDGGGSRENQDGKIGSNGKDDDKSDGGTTTSTKLTDKELTAKVEEKLLGCGLLDGPQKRDEGVEDEFDRCVVRCMLAATCKELTTLICDSEASQGLQLCQTKCDVMPADGFACKDGTKLPHAFVCDGDAQCPGSEDEAKCANLCDDGSVPNGQVTRCDGQKDCKDGSDEQGCPICG